MKHEEHEMQGAIPNHPPEFIRTDEAAKRLSITEKTIRQWIERRILPAFKPTRRTILIRVSDLEKAMARFRVG